MVANLFMTLRIEVDLNLGVDNQSSDRSTVLSEGLPWEKSILTSFRIN